MVISFSQCGSWGGVGLWSVSSKVPSRIILERLVEALDKQLRPEQAGFQKDRVCTNHTANVHVIVGQPTESQNGKLANPFERWGETRLLSSASSVNNWRPRFCRWHQPSFLQATTWTIKVKHNSLKRQRRPAWRSMWRQLKPWCLTTNRNSQFTSREKTRPLCPCDEHILTYLELQGIISPTQAQAHSVA